MSDNESDADLTCPDFLPSTSFAAAAPVTHILPPDLDFSFADEAPEEPSFTVWDEPLPFSAPAFHVPSPPPSADASLALPFRPDASLAQPFDVSLDKDASLAQPFMEELCRAEEELAQPFLEAPNETAEDLGQPFERSCRSPELDQDSDDDSILLLDSPVLSDPPRPSKALRASLANKPPKATGEPPMLIVDLAASPEPPSCALEKLVELTSKVLPQKGQPNWTKPEEPGTSEEDSPVKTFQPEYSFSNHFDGPDESLLEPMDQGMGEEELAQPFASKSPSPPPFPSEAPSPIKAPDSPVKAPDSPVKAPAPASPSPVKPTFQLSAAVARIKKRRSLKPAPTIVASKLQGKPGKSPKADKGAGRNLAEQSEKEALVEQTLARKRRLEKPAAEESFSSTTPSPPEQKRSKIKVKANRPRTSPNQITRKLTPVNDLFRSPPKRAQLVAKKLLAKASRPADPGLFKSDKKRRVAHNLVTKAKGRSAPPRSVPELKSPAFRPPPSIDAESPGGVLSQIIGKENTSPTAAQPSPSGKRSIFGLGLRLPATAPPPRKKCVQWRPDRELVQERPISPRQESAYWIWAKSTSSPLDSLLDAQLPLPATQASTPQPRSTFEDGIRTAILAWNRDWLDQYHKAVMDSKGKAKAVPPPITEPGVQRSFRPPKGLPEGPLKLEEYQQAFQQLLLCELWESLYQGFVKQQSLHPSQQRLLDLDLVCERCESSERFAVLHLAGLVHKASKERSALLSAYDSSLISADVRYGGTSGRPKRPVFGFVFAESLEMEDVPRPDAMPSSLRALWDESSGFTELKAAVENRGWRDLRSVRFKLIVRRVVAEQGRPSGVLTRPLLNFTTTAREVKGLEFLGQSPLGPAILAPEAKYFQLPPPSQPALLTESVQKLNASQTAAVAAIAEDVARPATSQEPRLSLIHGPPGTGKSRTIVSLVLETRARVAPSTDRHGLILITAPSNGAVDELSRSLIRASKGSAEQAFRFLRFGTEEGVAKDVQEHSLEHQVRLKAANPSCKLEKELLELESRLRSGSLHEAEARSLRKRRDFLEKRRRSQARELSESVRRDLLSKVDVVATTLSSAASPTLAALHRERKLLLVIVDEACQATEPEVLVPLAFGRTAKLVLVGDPEQLPPTVLSTHASEGGLSRSLFARLRESLSVPVPLLDTQYRMRPDIAAFPSQFFYAGALRTDASVSSRPALLSSPYTCVDLRYGDGEAQRGASKANETEARAVVEVVRQVRRQLGPAWQGVGVLSFYSAQVELISRRLREAHEDSGVETKTVDGFQGREKPVLIISCTRTRQAGFTEDRRRLNVALTRGREAVVVLGSLEALERRSETWRALVGDARERGRLLRVGSERSLAETLGRELRAA